MDQKKKLSPAVATLIVVVLVGIVASAAIVINNANNDESGSSQLEATTTQTSSPQTPSSTSTDTSTYANGTYSATGSYISPGGRESIELTVTITDGVITATEIKNNATAADSKEYQEIFADNYKSQVVGKSVDEVSLSRVAGSSLTSTGFNNALDQIKDDARA